MNIDDHQGRYFELSVCSKLQKSTCKGTNIGRSYWIFKIKFVMYNDDMISTCVCMSAIPSCTCTSTGSCQVENGGEHRNFSAGVANTNLQYISTNTLQLNYTGGALCHHNNQNRSTVITFVCAANPKAPEVLGESDDCTYYITWETRLACEKEVSKRNLANENCVAVHVQCEIFIYIEFHSIS